MSETEIDLMMDPSSQYQDKKYLRESQYRNSSNLGDRAQLHRRFSNNPLNWHAWIFGLLKLTPGMEILECGSGPGWLWRENSSLIPADCQITVTDLSPGMVAEAETLLGSSAADFRFEVADVTSLGFENDKFDLVIANHMLYHVPDSERQQALSEIRRTLRSDGVFIASTVGEGHMQELRDFSTQAFSIPMDLNRKRSITFTLENGRSQLEPWFTSIELHRYESKLVVTDVEPILAYVLSSDEVRSIVPGTQIKHAAQILEGIIADQGAFTITTSSGLFRAKGSK